MEDRDSALAIIQKFNGHQLPGAGLPLQVRFADSLAQKKLKGQTAKRRMWRTRGEFASLGGVSIILLSFNRTYKGIHGIFKFLLFKYFEAVSMHHTLIYIILTYTANYVSGSCYS